ncbi:MAG: PadR family transcriptional regulator [Patescibacteria group bacterium]
MDTENTRAQMRKGTLEFCILLIISRGKVYCSDILGALREADLLVVEGTVYPLLTRLKNSSLLSYDWEESPSGPPRKYYSLTPKGKETLKQLTLTWRSLDKSINSLVKKFK